MKNLIFEYNSNIYAIHSGAVYHWHGTHVSNIPYAMKSMNKGWIAYMHSMGQRPLTQDEIKIFEEKLLSFKELNRLVY